MDGVVHYNTLLLSRVYDQKVATGDEVAADILRGTSPNAWGHVHLTGAFDFEPVESGVDIDALVARYDDPDFWSRAVLKAPSEQLE